MGEKSPSPSRKRGIPFDVQYDVPWADTTCTPDFSPFEQLPILILENGDAVYDSSFLLEWLDYHQPEPALIPTPTGGSDRGAQAPDARRTADGSSFTPSPSNCSAPSRAMPGSIASPARCGVAWWRSNDSSGRDARDRPIR